MILYSGELMQPCIAVKCSPAACQSAIGALTEVSRGPWPDRDVCPEQKTQHSQQQQECSLQHSLIS